MELLDNIGQLKEHNINAKILFVSAEHDEIKRRYKETRRKHPLLDLAEGILTRQLTRNTIYLLRLDRQRIILLTPPI